MLLLLIALLAPCSVAAQDQPRPTGTPNDPLKGRAWSVAPWIGGAWNSPTTRLLGKTPGRDHFFLGLQAARPIGRWRRLNVSYTLQVLPVVVITGRTVPLRYGGRLAADGLLPDPARAYAAGIAPFGVEMDTGNTGRVSLFGAAAVGALIFTRPFPVVEAQRVNFTLEYGAGLRVRAGTGRWLQAGYKFHHLSNAYMVRMNPGLDAHLFYAGYQWRLRSR